MTVPAAPTDQSDHDNYPEAKIRAHQHAQPEADSDMDRLQIEEAVDGKEQNGYCHLGFHARHAKQNLLMFNCQVAADEQAYGEGESEPLRDAHREPDGDPATDRRYQPQQRQSEPWMRQLAQQGNQHTNWTGETMNVWTSRYMSETEAAGRVLRMLDRNETVFPGSPRVVPEEQTYRDREEGDPKDDTRSPARLHRHSAQHLGARSIDPILPTQLFSSSHGLQHQT